MALLTNQTTDTTGTGEPHTDSATVHVSGDFGNAVVSIEVSLDNSVWVKPDTAGGGVVKGPVAIKVPHDGAYYMRASVQNASGSTSITVKTTQSL